MGAEASQFNLLNDLFAVMSERETNGVIAIAKKMLALKPADKSLAELKLMVAYGGGKDSTYTVAFMRAVQLYLKQQQGETFILRVANMRHGGVPFAVMQNIHNVYDKLQLLNNPEAELLIIDNQEVSEFELHKPMPEEMLLINRNDILMNGHRSGGDGRPTFCNSCNLSVANFYGLACWHNQGVDFIVTGDSKKEQKHYATWIMRMGEKLNIDISPYRSKGFQGLLGMLNQVGNAFYQDLYGTDDENELALRHVSEGGTQQAPLFLSIYDEVSYRVDEHWHMVVEFLGFKFDELAFSFTESDCANPAFMAHLRGLKTQYVQQRSYLEGINEYLQLATKLMEKKEMPQNLVDVALMKYATAAKVDEMKSKITQYIFEVFGLTHDHLVTLVMSPFTNKGARLGLFMGQIKDRYIMTEQQIHDCLSGNGPGGNGQQSSAVIDMLETMTGLPMVMIKKLYHSDIVDFSDDSSMIAYIRKNDPHKYIIKTVDADSGKPTLELVSGR